MRIPCKHCEYMMVSINKEATRFYCANCKIIMTVGPMVKAKCGNNRKGAVSGNKYSKRKNNN